MVLPSPLTAFSDLMSNPFPTLIIPFHLRRSLFSRDISCRNYGSTRVWLDSRRIMQTLSQLKLGFEQIKNYRLSCTRIHVNRVWQRAISTHAPETSLPPPPTSHTHYPFPLSSIVTIDTLYRSKKNYAYAYLVFHDDEAMFIDNNTYRALPKLMAALEEKQISKERVKYIVVTHAHLDHSGATWALIQQCPNALVLAHPRAVPHLVDPTKLMQSARNVFGSQFFSDVYGDIQPISPSKVIAVDDGSSYMLGNRIFEMLYSPGHSKHHLVVHDPGTRSVFTGDAFGLSYTESFRQLRLPRTLPTFPFRFFNVSSHDLPLDSTRDFLFPSSSPIDFNPDDYHATIDRIVNLKVDRAYLTHAGVWENMNDGALQLHYGVQQFHYMMSQVILAMKQAQQQQISIDMEEQLFILEKKMHEFFVEELIKRGIDHENNLVLDQLQLDIELNAQGLLVASKREFLKSGGIFYKN